MSLAKIQRRKIRRAIGPQAEDLLVAVQENQIEIDRFLLLSHATWRRWWWVLTGRF